MDIEVKIANDKKCFNCGKVFKTLSNLQDHKKRKTPCIIREITPENVNNPNRCIYCNKIFSTKENLNKHFKTCKIRNGGMEVLVNKVQHDEEVKKIKEQYAEQLQHLEEKINGLAKQIVVQPVNNTTNNTN